MEEIGEAKFRRPKIRKQVRLTKSLSDNSLNSLIEKEEFSTSMKFTSLEAATQRCS